MSATLRPTSQQLSYAQLREGRVGLFLWPSPRSVLLALLAALAVAWLARHHAPWRFVADIPVDLHGDLVGQTPFVPSIDGLLTFDTIGGVNLVDLRTGRVRNKVLPVHDYGSGNFDTGFQVLNKGDRLALLTTASPTIRIYNTRTGHIDSELLNPIAGQWGSVLLSPDGTKIVTYIPNDRFFTGVVSSGRNRLRISGAYDFQWPVSPGWSLPRQDHSAAFGSCLVWKYGVNKIPEIIASSRSGEFSPLAFLNGGKRLLGSHAYDKAMLDVDDLHVVLSLDGMVYSPSNPDTHCVESVAVSMSPIWHYTLISTDDDNEVDSADSAQGVFWSPDLSVRAVLRPQGTPFSMSLFDRKSGKLLRSIIEPMSVPTFFPNGGRFVARASDGPYLQAAVYDSRHRQPLALLNPTPGGSAGQDDMAEVSADGRSILIHRTVRGFSGYRLFRQTGWDCPESAIGVLAFPQTWLTLVLLLAAGASLLADARAQAVHAPYRPAAEIVFPLIAVSLLLTWHFTIEACLGHWIRSPAPLIVIACIGMARGSRAWRWIAVLILCSTVAWCGSRAVALRSVHEDFYPLFDRVYEFPQSMRLALMIVTTLILAATTMLLARPSRLS